MIQLKPASGAPAGDGATYALFSISLDYDGPANALDITPNASGTDVEVKNLFEPGAIQTVPLVDAG